MIPHPPTLDTAHGTAVWEPVCRATFYSPAGLILSTQDVTGGSYRASAGQWPRAEATIDLATALTAAGTTPPVSPYGGRVSLAIGARVAGTEHTFQLCDLDVTETEIRRPEGIMSIRASSHEARVNEDRVGTRTATAAGATATVVRDLVRATLGATWPMASSLTSNPVLAAGAYPLDGDVWPTIVAMLDAAAGEAWFGPLGQLVLRDAPVKGSPVITYRTGEDPNIQGTLLGYASTRGWAFNGVAVVYEEATGATPGRVVGTWQDTTSTSSVSSPYGRHTRVDRIGVDAGKLPSGAAANAAAAAIGKRAQGRYRSIELRTIPTPWIEPGDTVRVVQLGAATEDMLVDTVTIPLLQLDAMTLEGRDPAYTATA